MKRIGAIAILAAALAMACGAWRGSDVKAQATAAGETSWGGLQFLVGTWGAAVHGKAEGSTYTFAPELNGHVLVRRCATGCDKGPMGPNYSDVLYVYKAANGQADRAIFFDSEGHVLQYDVTSSTPGKAVFLSDGSTPGPRFQLTYEMAGGVMKGKFEMLPPGGAPAKQLSEWSGAKK